MEDLWNTWRQIRWSGGIACVFCRTNQYCRHSVRRGGLFRYRCLNCRRIFSDISGTFLQSSKISLEKWRVAAMNYSQNRQSNLRALQQILGMSYPTVLRMMRLFRRTTRNRQLQKNGVEEAQHVNLLFLLIESVP